MATLEGQRVVVTGGSCGLGLGLGLGLGILEALVSQKAHVTVGARDPERLAEVSKRLGVNVTRGDVTDEKLAQRALTDVRRSVRVPDAGATPQMGPPHELTRENFNRAWDIDVHAGFQWVQETLRLPLPRGGRAVIASSGAALSGSPLSGSHVGAKRMLWLMAHCANDEARRLDLDIRFQAIVPQQIMGDTDLGRKAAEAHARSKGVSLEVFLAGFGAPMPPSRSATTSCRSSPIRATPRAWRSA